MVLSPLLELAPGATLVRRQGVVADQELGGFGGAGSRVDEERDGGVEERVVLGGVP
ncbi:hypothetical protein NKH18_01355 [Streptomyces sp. M10(2022)]